MRATDVGVEATRFFQPCNLPDTPINSTGYRTYGNEHEERLRFIKRIQAVGFSLNEVAELLQLNDSHDHL